MPRSAVRPAARAKRIASKARIAAAAAGLAATQLADVMAGMRAELALDSFSAITNPRRRRVRRGSGAYHVDYSTAEELRLISRSLEYEAGTYGGLLSSWETYLVGAGPAWCPATTDTAWNQQAAQVIGEMLLERQHDVRRRHSWGRWIKLIARGIARDGQIGIAHSAYGAAQLVEAERIIDIKATPAGAPVEYIVADFRKGQLDRASAKPVAADAMDVPAVITRTSQQLGIPICFSSLDDHDGIADLWQAEIDSATESARPWLRLEESDAGLPAGITIPEVLQAGADAALAAGTQVATVGRHRTPAGWLRTPNGNIIGIPKGLKSQVHQPMRPNMDVPAFSKEMLRVCCMVLLPYELAFLDQAGINMSNGRGIVRMGNLLLSAFRSDHLNLPLTRVVRGLLRKAMLDGRLPYNAQWRAGELEWEPIPEHDRGRERLADATDMANGTASLKDIAGSKWQAVMRQRAVELDEAATLVALHNAKHPALRISITQVLGDPGHIAMAAAQQYAIADAQAATAAVAPATPGKPALPAPPAPADPVGAPA